MGKKADWLESKAYALGVKIYTNERQIERSAGKGNGFYRCGYRDGDGKSIVNALLYVGLTKKDLIAIYEDDYSHPVLDCIFEELCDRNWI